MAFALCLLYVAVIYVRPGEIVPALASLSITWAVGLVATAVTAFSFVLKPRPVAESPIDWCFLAFCAVAVVTAPFHGWLGAAFRAFQTLLPLAIFYFLIRLTVQTKRQLQILIGVIVLLTVFQAANGILQHYTGFGVGGSTAYADRARMVGDEYTDRPEVLRIRGTGIFSDPNDLAMSLVLVFPFLFTMLLSPRAGSMRRLVAVGGIALLTFAIILTRSRGGLVGLGALCAAYGVRRFGLRRAVPFLLVLGGILAVVFLTRETLDPSEMSSQGRVQAWAVGLQLLKSNPLIGVGFGNFLEYNELVAHNSFVHSLAELGLIGAIFFVGMIYWFLVGTTSRRDVAGASASTLAMDITASGIGILVCATFLSRQYTPILYVPIALGATRMAVERPAGTRLGLFRPGDVARVIALTLLLTGAVYVVVRLFAIWSPR
jgi:O-Antigen ligase